MNARFEVQDDSQPGLVYSPCSMGVGCDEYGKCYAEAHGQPHLCMRYGGYFADTMPALMPAEACTDIGSDNGDDDGGEWLPFSVFDIWRESTAGGKMVLMVIAVLGAWCLVSGLFGLARMA